MAATGAAQLRPKPGLFLWGHFDDNLGGHGRFSSAVRLMGVVPVSLNETAAALNPLLLCPISLWTDLALQLERQRGIRLSAETVRRCLHALDWVWKRAKLVAKDNDPERASKLARIRYVSEHLGGHEVLLFADELDLHLLPKVGAQWMPRATQVEVMTPGKNECRYLAGALDLRTGQVHYRLWFRKMTGLFLDLLNLLDCAYPARRFHRIFIVVDNSKIHKAAAVQRWLQQHPRFVLWFLPTYCPRANPIERCFGDLHDKVTRNHRRKRRRDLVADVERHLAQNGPWHYQLSDLYHSAEVTKAFKKQVALCSSAVA